MVFSRHLYFVDYTQYGCDIQYFNMVSIVLAIVTRSMSSTQSLGSDPRSFSLYGIRARNAQEGGHSVPKPS